MSQLTKYYAHGKLLITGEYAVLDGALALAIPIKKGQWLSVESNAKSANIFWKSLDENGGTWFECEFTPELEIVSSSSTEIAERLIQILEICANENPEFAKHLSSKSISTTLEFNRHWGLGSSSTLIHLISQWANVNPYKILEATFGGSGYDIACANTNNPITFQLLQDVPSIKTVAFNPEWKNNMHFVYLGKKQVSKSEVAKYSDMNLDRVVFTQRVTNLTKKVLKTTNQAEFESTLQAHENLVSEALGYPTIKSRYFQSVKGTFKSLGAWGGDFVLFVGESEEIKKIKSLGYKTVVSWHEMVLD